MPTPPLSIYYIGGQNGKGPGWSYTVEADMAKLEIDKEDVHDRSKWRRDVNVMKRKSNPIGKQTINR